MTERLFRMVRDFLRQDKATAHLDAMVRCYRAGYTRAQRREIEHQLFDGQVRSRGRECQACV